VAQSFTKPSWLHQAAVWIFHAAHQIINGVQKHQVLYLAFASAAYFAGTYWIVSVTPFHGDEFFTLYLSQLPTVKQIWSALASGLEALPPTIHLTTRVVEHWLGSGLFVSRLVSIVGFWVMLLSVYGFVARRRGAVYAAVASLFPMFTMAYSESCQLRPYGLVLAGCGMSLLFWQRATEGGRRIGALVGLSLSLALAVASHYYSVLLLAPFAAGELVRMRLRGRPDWPLWIALAAALMPLVLFIPLILSSTSQALLWASPFTFFHVLVIYRTDIHPVLLTSLILMVIVAVTRWLGTAAGTQPDPKRPAIPAHEIAAVVVLALLPFVLALSAALVTKAFFWHHAISFVAGLAILFGFAASEATSDNPVLAATTFLAMIVLIAGAAYKKAEGASGDTWNTLRAVRSPLFSLDEQLPIGIANTGLFLALQHYAPRPVSARLQYVTGTNPAHKADDKDVSLLSRWTRFSVISYDSFLQVYPCFLIYERNDERDAYPVMNKLLADHKRVLVRGRDEFGELFLVNSAAVVHREEGSAPGPCEAH